MCVCGKVKFIENLLLMMNRVDFILIMACLFCSSSFSVWSNNEFRLDKTSILNIVKTIIRP